MKSIWKATKIVSLVALSSMAVACGGSAKLKVKTTVQAPVAEEKEEPEEEVVALVDDHLELNDHIIFAHNSDEPLADSYEILDAAVVVLKEHSEIERVSVEGHTDMRGSKHHNRRLSKERAKAVASYLREQGVPQDVVAVGYGEAAPVCMEGSRECDARNRRVEFIVE